MKAFLLIPFLLFGWLFFAQAQKANRNYIPAEIDINLADTTLFEALPGIGPKLAARIVQYREKLGGFYRVEQVAETWGLADSTFQKIKKWLVVKTPVLKKININTATAEELRMPYLSWNQANAIYQYRLQHGLYKCIDDLKKILLMSDETIARIAPYITL